MSKIKIFSLGGLNENGKNMYVVNVDSDIFVFDAGLNKIDKVREYVINFIDKSDYLDTESYAVEKGKIVIIKNRIEENRCTDKILTVESWTFHRDWLLLNLRNGVGRAGEL